MAIVQKQLVAFRTTMSSAVQVHGVNSMGSRAGIILGVKFSPWTIFRGFSAKKDSPFYIFLKILHGVKKFSP